MSNPETILLQEIRLALGEIPGVVMYRNHIGHDGRAHVDYGICNPGGSDLIGLVVGDFIGPPKHPGIFLAIEVKTATGIVSEEQRRFISIVRKNGGYAGIARTIQDAIDITQGIIHD